MIRSLSLLALAALLLVSVGCSSEAAAATINDACPMMGGDVDPALTVAYEGGEVGFCCAKCIPQWEALSDEEKAAALASDDSTSEPDGHEGHGH